MSRLWRTSHLNHPTPCPASRSIMWPSVGLDNPAPVALTPAEHMGSFFWPVPLSACSFSWQMFHIWYLQHPEVSSTIRLHLHAVPHCLLRGCPQGIWPCMVHIALFHRLLSGNSVQSFMTPVTACLQNQHHVDSTKFCWEVVRLSCIMTAVGDSVYNNTFLHSPLPAGSPGTSFCSGSSSSGTWSSLSSTISPQCVCLLVSDANLCKDDSDFSDTHFPVTVNIVTLLCSMHGLLLFILKWWALAWQMMQ